MTKHSIGTREEWQAERLKLLEAEKELTRQSDELGTAEQNGQRTGTGGTGRGGTERGSR